MRLLRGTTQWRPGVISVVVMALTAAAAFAVCAIRSAVWDSVKQHQLVWWLSLALALVMMVVLLFLLSLV